MSSDHFRHQPFKSLYPPSRVVDFMLANQSDRPSAGMAENVQWRQQRSALDRVAPLIVNFDFGTAFRSSCYCRESKVEGEFPRNIDCCY